MESRCMYFLNICFKEWVWTLWGPIYSHLKGCYVAPFFSAHFGLSSVAVDAPMIGTFLRSLSIHRPHGRDQHICMLCVGVCADKWYHSVSANTCARRKKANLSGGVTHCPKTAFILLTLQIYLLLIRAIYAPEVDKCNTVAVDAHSYHYSVVLLYAGSSFCIELLDRQNIASSRAFLFFFVLDAETRTTAAGGFLLLPLNYKFIRRNRHLPAGCYSALKGNEENICWLGQRLWFVGIRMTVAEQQANEIDQQERVYLSRALVCGHCFICWQSSLCGPLSLVSAYSLYFASQFPLFVSYEIERARTISVIGLTFSSRNLPQSVSLSISCLILGFVVHWKMSYFLNSHLVEIHYKKEIIMLNV